MNNLSEDHFNNENGRNLGNSADDLPIMKYKNEIIEAVKNNQFVIIRGGVGCDKIIKVPQFLYEDGTFSDRQIGITQPSEPSVVSVAKQVAYEMNDCLGKSVGYEIRFDQRCNASTKIKYMSEEILYNEIILDRRLNDYGVIFIDEVHERTLITDVLFGLLRRIAASRRDLKVVISSTNIRVDKFREYFDNPRVISLDLCVSPIYVVYNDYCRDYIMKIVEIIKEIYQTEMLIRQNNKGQSGDTLVFLSDEEEIYFCCNELSTIENVVPMPLYGSMDIEDQQGVLVEVRPCELKVVVATNIAETNVTITGLKYVIDCGWLKQTKYNANRGIDVLEDVRISKGQAQYRKDKAGRIQPSICHRLYQKSTYDSFMEEPLQEIYRKDLTEMSLKFKSLGLEPNQFRFLDAPLPEELGRCDRNLIDLLLMNLAGRLTPLGVSVALLPFDPVLNKVIITSLSSNCAMSVICIASMISVKMEKIFRRPRNNIHNADLKKRQFFDPSGDHFTLLNVYKAWMGERNRERWCEDNFIDHKTMTTVDNTINEIIDILKLLPIPTSDSYFTGQPEDVMRCFVGGYHKNICIRQPMGHYRRSTDGESFFIDDRSSLSDVTPEIILFHNAIKSSKSVAFNVLQLDETFLRDN